MSNTVSSPSAKLGLETEKTGLHLSTKPSVMRQELMAEKGSAAQ